MDSARDPLMIAPEMVEAVAERIRPPVAIVLGSPREAAELIEWLPLEETLCYQMDLFQAERLQEELAERDLEGQVITSPDLWDLPADFQTVLYPLPKGGERSLKIDMIEQAYHILPQHGKLIVFSPFEHDSLIPGLLKKVFGKFHQTRAERSSIYWAQRVGDHSRRRHEVTFQVRVADGPSLRFLSRPGVFSYGRFDDGARALVETMQIGSGDRILDIGCGCGTNGIFAAKQSGPFGTTTFIDSNVRAITLAEHNARANGLVSFQVIASSNVEGPEVGSFDVVLANPPYHAQLSIARLFIERARVLLRPGGRLYLVTKQADQLGPVIAELFGLAEPVERRGYVVLQAQCP